MRKILIVTTLLASLALSSCSALTLKQKKQINTKQYQGKGYEQVIKYAKINKVSDINLALAVAKAESDGRCKLTGPRNYTGKRARGIMQVMPDTAAKWGITKPSQLYKCSTGANVGTKELADCQRKAKNDFNKTLICYNAGPGYITKGTRWYGKIPGETKNYIKKITKYYYN